MSVAVNKIIDKIIVADARGRVNLGAQAVGKHFAIKQTNDGEYSLTPMVVFPEREAWLWRSKEARASFDKGVQESEAGLGVPMDFSAYLEDDTE